MNSFKSLLSQSQQNFLNLFRRNAKSEGNSSVQIPNPIRLLSMLSIVDWCTFISAYFCVMIDFMEFSTVAVEIHDLATYFQTSNTAVTLGLTLSMISGVVGAILFGLLGDCGRKTPLVINCIYLGLTQILITQCTSIKYFLIVKAMAGFGMGGLFGNALQSVMDRVPTEAKGLAGGLLWSAGDVAIFLTSAIKLALNKTQREHDWKLIFWVSAGFCFAAAIVRICVPESPQFKQESKAETKKKKQISTFQKVQKKVQNIKGETHVFMVNAREIFKTHWMTFIYLTFFVSLLSSASSSYEAIYPIFLEEGKEFDKQSVPKTVMIVSAGGFIGSCSGAGFSQFTGRRLGVIIASFVALCFLPAYVLPAHPAGLSIGGFFFVMASNMANSIISIHISELSSPAFRSVMSGSAYQLGITLASPTGVVINALATYYQSQKMNAKGEVRIVKAYEPVIGITTSILYFLVIFLTAVGPEKHSADFDKFIPANREVRKDPFVQSDSSKDTTSVQKVA